MSNDDDDVDDDDGDDVMAPILRSRPSPRLTVSATLLAVTLYKRRHES